MMNNDKAVAPAKQKGNAIQFEPDTMDEWNEIKKAADSERRSLANFCLIASLKAARSVNGENA